MASAPHRPLYVVTVAAARDEVAAALSALPGTRIVRRLDARRLVVSLRSTRDAAAVAALPGVVAVMPDRLEHPTGRDRPTTT